MLSNKAEERIIYISTELSNSEVRAMQYSRCRMSKQPKGLLHIAVAIMLRAILMLPVYVVIPDVAPKCKVDNVICFGGQLVLCEGTILGREAATTKVIQETGVFFIPSNDGRIISGQGTIALELMDQIPQIDTIIVPLSGGGMISGIALVAKSINPAIRIVGADDAFRSKAAGEIVTLPNVKTIGDGLVGVLGNNIWPIIRDLEDDIIVVEDDEIIKAMKLCFEILKMVVEPTGAIGLAVLLSEHFKSNPRYKDCKNVGIILE